MKPITSLRRRLARPTIVDIRTDAARRSHRSILWLIAGGLIASTGLAAPGLAAPTRPALAVARFTAPMQPWRSDDGHVALLRPATVEPPSSDAPLGSLMARGWRLVWDGKSAGSGRLVARFALPAVADDPDAGSVAEVLQIGVSRDPDVVRDCLRYGLDGASATPLPDRRIHGIDFTARRHADAGMSQRIEAIDLRAVAGGACYAVERFAYSVASGVASSSATMPRARAVAALDAALDSLTIDPLAIAKMPELPRIALPPGAVAR